MTNYIIKRAPGQYIKKENGYRGSGIHFLSSRSDDYARFADFFFATFLVAFFAVFLTAFFATFFAAFFFAAIVLF